MLIMPGPILPMPPPPRGGGGTQKSFIRGGSAPRSNPLPFYIPFFQKRYPFRIPFIGKRHPFHIPCHFFHVVRNKLKWNSHELRLLDLFKFKALFNTRVKIFLPFYIPKLVKSLPFYIPEAWKRYPFRAEPPRIGHYTKYPPPPPGAHASKGLLITSTFEGEAYSMCCKIWAALQSMKH